MQRVSDRQQASKQAEGVRDNVPALALDESRLAMMRRVKAMTVEQRLDLFEQLSRDAAWALSAKRVR